MLAIAACGGGDDDAPPMPSPRLVLPAVIAVPYVEAGAGASAVTVEVRNDGDADTGPLVWGVHGDAGFTLGPTPTVLAAGDRATLTVRWDGAATESIAGAVMAVMDGADALSTEVWAVAGAPDLAAATFEPVLGAGGVTIGASAVVSLPTAPYPAPGRPWTDDRVHLFVPADWRERDAQDVVLHFHGHNSTIDRTVPAHRYREQLYASGADAILIVPQGPVQAASGDFGKLAEPAGTAALLDEVLIVLYRAGVVTRPVLGQVTLTAHSGGYVATAQNLDPDARFAVGQVGLFDALYGSAATFRAFALRGLPLRSNYTTGGGTLANNQQLARDLAADGLTVATAATAAALREPAPVIAFTPASHDGAPRESGAWGEWLRWSAPHGRRGPRVELRAATTDGADGVVRWLAPRDRDVTGWVVELTTAAGVTTVELPATADTATVPLAGPTRVTVRPRLGPTLLGQPSDTYAFGAAHRVLVVDGFDRVLDGSYGGLAHDGAARVATAAGGADTVAAAAVTDDGFALADYPVVIWLVGDDSTADHTFTAAERAALDAYVAGGGRAILSGSEVGFDLGEGADGRAWLAALTGAAFASDDANANEARGADALASVPRFGFGGPTALYREEFPDALTATGAGRVVLRYDGDAGAAVGLAGRAALVGFPLEVIDDDSARAAVVRALIAFVAP